MSDEAVTEERAPAPPAPTTVTATPAGPAPATSSNGVMALQSLIGNRATGRAVQRHVGTHPGPDGHSEADHPAAGDHRTVSALLGTEDPITAIHRVSGFGRSLRADDSRLQSFSAIGWLQPWMFHPTEAWILTESHIIVQGAGRTGMLRPRAEMDPRPRDAGTVHLRLNNGRWMQLVLATPGNTVFVRPASAVDGSFGDQPSVMVASLPGVRLDTTQVRRIEGLFRPDGLDEHAGDVEEEAEASDGSAADDSTGGGDNGGGSRPRARELTEPWAITQVHAANLQRQIRARQAANAAPAEPGDERSSPGGSLPTQIMSMPGETARATRNGTRVRIRQERWETGRQLLDRLIAALDRQFLPTDRVEDPDLPEAAPDWVRHQFRGARSLLEADRRRLLPLTEDARDAADGGDRPPDEAIIEAEARQAIERRLLERAAGLPERFELDHGGRQPYAVHIRVGRRGARIRMQAEDTPSALYARVRGVAGDLAAPVSTGLRIDVEESTLIRGQRSPYPIAIEMMNSTTAVAGRPQWFRMEIDSGSEAPPRLAVTWLVAPVTGDEDDADIALTRIAEHGAVADLELREALEHRLENIRDERPRTGITFVDLESARALGAVEMIGAVADGGRMVIGHIAERSAERGILFPGPGRYVVSVIAQPDVEDSDREHTGISEANVRAPSRTAISLDVVASDERLDDLVEESLDEIEQRQRLLRQIESLESQIAALDEDDERGAALRTELAGLQAELTQLEGNIDVARGRGSATMFGYLGRKMDAAQAQRALVDEIIANLGTGDDLQQRHNLLRYARQQEAERNAARSEEGDETAREEADPEAEPRVVLLYDQLHLQWTRERTRGLERPPFTEWLQQQSGQLRQAADVASRQSLGLFVRGRDLGRATRLPGALIASDGRQLPLTLALHQTISPGEGDTAGTTTYQILDLSEVGAPNSSDEAPIFEGTAPGTDSHAASTALDHVVTRYVDEAGYGYGQLVIHRPPTLSSDIEFAASRRFELRPSERERWIERLENIGIVVGMMGMIATGPVGIALGVIGATTGAAAAGLRMSHRSDRGTLDLDSETVQDVVDIVTAPLAIAGAAANVRRMSRTAMLARLERSGVVLTGDAAANVIRGLPDALNTLADADDIVGVLQAGQQVYALPSGVIDGLVQAQSIEDPVERRAATMEALASGAIALPGALHGLHGAHGTLGEMAETRARGRRTRSTLRPRAGERAGGGETHGTTGGGPVTTGHPDPTGTTTTGATSTGAEATGTGTETGTGATSTGTEATGTTTETARPTTGAETAGTTGATESDTTGTSDTTATASEADVHTAGRTGDTVHTGDRAPETATTRRGRDGRPADDASSPATSEGGGPTPSPTPVLRRMIENGTGTPVESEAALRDAGNLNAIRSQLNGLSESLQAELGAALQTARLAVVQEHIDTVVARVSAEHPHLDIVVQNLGSRGLASDSDITVRVEGPVENPEHPWSDAERAALDRELVIVSLETVPRLYAELEAAGFPPERSLDTNFYSELREDSFGPADAAEARGISADQEIVSLTEVMLNLTPAQWDRFRRRQLAAIASDTEIPDHHRTLMAERFRAEVSAAEATAARLLGAVDAGSEADTRDSRNIALEAARQRLIDGLTQQPPLASRDIRRLMADVKLLEPDAFGARAAVEGVVLGDQAMRGAHTEAVVGSEVRDDVGRSRRPRRRAEIEEDTGSIGTLRWDPETGDLVESSAEDEAARLREAAHRHVGRRRPGDEAATTHDIYSRFLSAAQAIYGHLLHHIPTGHIEPQHTSTAAKNVHRIAEMALRMGLPLEPGFSHLGDIIASKGAEDPVAATREALRRWAEAAGVTVRPEGDQAATDQAMMRRFLHWTTHNGESLVRHMRRRAGHAAVMAEAEMGSTATSEPVTPRADRSRNAIAPPPPRSATRVSPEAEPSRDTTPVPAPASPSGETPATETTRRTIIPPAPATPTSETPATETTRRTIIPPAPATPTSSDVGATAAGGDPHPRGIATLPDVRRGIQETFGREVPPRSAYVQAASDFHYRRDWIAEDPDGRRDKVPPDGHFDRRTGTIHFPPHAVLETIVHESLHALTHPDFYTAIPIWLNEGITEILTEQTTGSNSPSTAYRDNIEIARLLIDAVGMETVRAAYFDGDSAGLSTALNRHTGDERSLATLGDQLLGPGDAAIDEATLAFVRRFLLGRDRDDDRPSIDRSRHAERPTVPSPSRGGSR